MSHCYNMSRIGMHNMKETNVSKTTLVRKYEKRHQCKEDLHSFRSCSNNSEFSQHLIENCHAMCPISEVVGVLYTSKNGGHVTTI
jgi:hypothetical protein